MHLLQNSKVALTIASGRCTDRLRPNATKPANADLGDLAPLKTLRNAPFRLFSRRFWPAEACANRARAPCKLPACDPCPSVVYVPANRTVGGHQIARGAAGPSREQPFLATISATLLRCHNAAWPAACAARWALTLMTFLMAVHWKSRQNPAYVLSSPVAES